MYCIDKEKLLNKLIQHFYRLSLNFTLQDADVKLMSPMFQQQILDSTVNGNLNKKYPQSNKFIKLYLKKILNSIESIQEIYDEFYTILCDVVTKEECECSFYFKHYIIDNNLHKVITLKETNNMVVNGTTGMRTWDAALMLADWALSNKELVRDKKIIELGSGIGFTGITIAKFCKPESILLTDCHCDVLNTICHNIVINFPDLYDQEYIEETSLFKDDQHCIGVKKLDWNEINSLPENVVPDVIIGADIVYDPSVLQPLCNVLKAFIERNKELEIYICCVIRNEETITSFLECLDTNGLIHENIQTKSEHIIWDESIPTCFLKIGTGH